MSDDLHKYPGNLKHHKVDVPAKTYPPVSATSEDLFSQRPDWLLNSHDRDIGEYWIDELQEARAKDAEEIAKWKGIVKGVHGALTDIGTVPVPAIDADLYDAVMSISAKDAELIQMLVDALWDSVSTNMNQRHKALYAAAAEGFKPSEQ